MVVERCKKQDALRIYADNHFWRTYDRKEIDWIEEREGRLFGFEFKWGSKPFKPPKEFMSTYQNSEVSLINRMNLLEFTA